MEALFPINRREPSIDGGAGYPDAGGSGVTKAATGVASFDLSRTLICFVALQEARDWIPRAAKTRAAPRTRTLCQEAASELPAARAACPRPPLARAARFA